MTSEQLAAFISQGGNDELIPLLWEKVRKTVYCKAEHFYRLHSASCKLHGVDAWDIKQASYFAFLDALKGYKPESNLKFITFISLPMKKAVYELLGLRSSRQQNEPLNNCISLDECISDEHGTTTLLEMQEDTTSLRFVERLESELASDIIRSEVEGLREPHCQVIKQFYFESKSLSEIAVALGVSSERVRQIRVEAERKLRGSSVLRELYEEHYKMRFNPRHKYYDWQPEHYDSRYIYKNQCNALAKELKKVYEYLEEYRTRQI